MSQQMIDQFMEMVRIDSESGEEAEMISYLVDLFQGMGGTAERDPYGNCIASFPAKGCTDRPHLLLSCHADTVKPGKGIQPVLSSGVISSTGQTILGADDKAGIAEVVEALRLARVHPPLEIAVSRQEEIGLFGAKKMDMSRFKARRGFLMDNDSLLTIAVGWPSCFTIDVTVNGKAAHSGMKPEQGINAIQAASRAIAALRLGRLAPGTTANVGIIHGGTIRNGVPATTTFAAECRSADHDEAARLAQEMEEIITREARALGASAKVEMELICRAVHIPEDAWTVETARKAIKTLGIDPRPIIEMGYTDASIFNNRGIEMAGIGIGVKNEHSTEECVLVSDMERSAQALVEILRISAE